MIHAWGGEGRFSRQHCLLNPFLVARASSCKEKRLLHSIPRRREEEGSGGRGRKKKILLLNEKINEHRTRTTKISQCRA